MKDLAGGEPAAPWPEEHVKATGWRLYIVVWYKHNKLHIIRATWLADEWINELINDWMNALIK